MQGCEAATRLVEEHPQLVAGELQGETVQLVVEEGRLGDLLICAADLPHHAVALAARPVLHPVPRAAAVQRPALHLDALEREARLLWVGLCPELLIDLTVEPLKRSP